MTGVFVTDVCAGKYSLRRVCICARICAFYLLALGGRCGGFQRVWVVSASPCRGIRRALVASVGGRS